MLGEREAFEGARAEFRRLGIAFGRLPTGCPAWDDGWRYRSWPKDASPYHEGVTVKFWREIPDTNTINSTKGGRK